MGLTDDKIIDLNLDGIQKQKFRINGDDNAILELNTSDLGIADRLEKGYKVLVEETKKIAEADDENLTKVLAEADKVMREQLDYIFDSNVSEVCGKGGSMYDPVNGSFRFEHIINGLTKLYSDNLNNEYQKMKDRIQKHTGKYVGGNTKSRKRN